MQEKPIQTRWKEWRNSTILFIAIWVYIEIMIHLFLYHSISGRIIYPVFFGILAGIVTSAISSVLPKIPGRIIGFLFTGIGIIYAETQLIYFSTFGTIMPISLIKMGGDVFDNFGEQILMQIWHNIIKVIALVLPAAALVLYIFLRRTKRVRTGLVHIISSLGIFFLFSATILISMLPGQGKIASVYYIFSNSSVSTDISFENLGMIGSTSQEIRAILSGEEDSKLIISDIEKNKNGKGYSSKEYNVIDSVDFKALAESTDEKELEELDEYLAGVEPAKKNKYTGMLKDYNVISLCAESFSSRLISEELTPTLYKMINSGFVFKNYYGTFNSVTTDGEYTMCTGLFPDLSRGKTNSSFDLSASNYLPFCLGNMLKKEGYTTFAYHNYIGNYYNRDKTHPNMGYTFKAADSGLNITIDWPSSDLEMMEASMDDYISSEVPFHAYYMTFSGHYSYNWNNPMSAKHRAEVEDLDHDPEVQAYIACNLEVEYALRYILERLEEAGKLDKTVIVLTNDHYPYGLSEEQYNDLSGEKVDTSFEKYRNAFICYVPSMDESIIVDDYCSTEDILPTMLNLLGVPYDSRLLAGVDVLSDSPHTAIIYNRSFINDRIKYDSKSGNIIYLDPEAAPDGNNPLTDEELMNYIQYVNNKFSFSSNILNSNYYAHVFDVEESDISVEDTIQFSDLTGDIFEQAQAVFMVRKGYVDPESETVFGRDKKITLGEALDILYRVSGSPEIDPSLYPADYSNGYKYAKAVAYAYESGLLREGDVQTVPEDEFDFRTASLLTARYAEILGKNTYVSPEEISSYSKYDHSLKIEEVKAMIWNFKNNVVLISMHLDTFFEIYHNNTVSKYQMTKYMFRMCTYNLE